MSPIDFRLAELERRTLALEQAEPRVLAERIANLAGLVSDLRDEVRATRHALVAFLVTFALSGISIVIALFVVFQ